MLLTCYPILSQTSIIDSTFGNGGEVFTPLNTVGIKSCVSLVQTDGKIVLAGSYYDVGNPTQPSTAVGGPGYVVRYHSNGSLDSSFGVNGIYVDSSIVFLSTIIQLSNGKLVLGGAKSGFNNSSILAHEGVLKRLNMDGTIDTLFGNGGTAELPLVYGGDFTDAKVNEVEELTNGKLMVYGTGRELEYFSGGGSDHPTGFLARFHSDGTVDTSFGGVFWWLKGIIIYNTPIYSTGFRGISKVLKINSDRMLLSSSDYRYSTGFAPGYPSFGYQSFELYRIDSLGKPDSSFNFYSASGSMRSTTMAFQDHKILCAGFGSSGGTYSNPYPTLSNSYYVRRFNLNGELDITFNNSSVFINSNAIATDLYVLPSDYFIVLGISKSGSGSESYLTIARFLPDGQLDYSCLGPPIYNGLPSLYTAGPYAESTPSIVKADGSKILVASLRDSAGSYGFQLARYIIDSDSTQVYYANDTLYTNRTTATYQWLDCINMQPVSGATNQSFVPTATGSYAVIVTENGCTDTSACYTISSVGLNHWSESGISLYPNPSSGLFTLDLNNQRVTGDLRIYKVDGQIIYDQKLAKESKIELDLDLPKGVYLLQVNSGNSVIYKRISVD